MAGIGEAYLGVPITTCLLWQGSQAILHGGSVIQESLFQEDKPQASACIEPQASVTSHSYSHCVR